MTSPRLDDNDFGRSGNDVILIMERTSTGAGNQNMVVDMSSMDLQLKLFPHPKGYGMLLVDYENELYEIQVASPRKYSSWFINQRVSSSRAIHLASRIDPRFLCLPFLEKSTKYSPLDQIIHLPEQYARFPFHAVPQWKMHEICDVNDKLGDDMILYRYNEDKVIAWLRAKVAKTATILGVQRIRKSKLLNPAFVSGFNSSAQRNSSTSASNTDKSMADENHDPVLERETLIQALEAITDYLTPTTAQKLRQTYALLSGIATSTSTSTSNESSNTNNNGGGGTKRKADWELELELEKETLAYSGAGVKSSTGLATNTSSSSNNNNDQYYSNNSKANNASLAAKTAANTVKVAKAHQTAAKGTKSLFSFFGGGGSKK